MKSVAKRLLSTGLALCMAGALSAPALALTEAEYTKNENVYVRLQQDGEVSGTYVVNTFNVTKDGEVSDYGDYAKIQNLTNLDPIECDRDEQTFRAETGRFSYQGDMDGAELPWSFDIAYILDGDEVEGDELAGEDGDLDIRLRVRRNTAFTGPAFFDAYMLQVSLTLDPDLCEDIKAPGATLTDAGSNVNATFLVNPGTEADLLVSMEVSDFEMDDISINAAAVTDFSESFVSDENTRMGKTTFIISSEGVTIPDVEDEPAEEEEEPGFLERLLDLFKSLFE